MAIRDSSTRLLDVSTPAHPNIVALVDADIYEQVSKYKWHTDHYGYVCRTARTNGIRHKVFLHKLVKPALPGKMTDHKDGDLLNNRRANLRICNNGQNQQNSRPNSGRMFKGVFRHTKVAKFEAKIGRLKRSIYLGLYHAPEGAARAYDLAAMEMFGRFAKLNFPELKRKRPNRAQLEFRF